MASRPGGIKLAVSISSRPHRKSLASSQTADSLPSWALLPTFSEMVVQHKRLLHRYACQTREEVCTFLTPAGAAAGRLFGACKGKADIGSLASSAYPGLRFCNPVPGSEQDCCRGLPFRICASCGRHTILGAATSLCPALVFLCGGFLD